MKALLLSLALTASLTAIECKTATISAYSLEHKSYAITDEVKSYTIEAKDNQLLVNDVIFPLHIIDEDVTIYLLYPIAILESHNRYYLRDLEGLYTWRLLCRD